MLLLGQWHSLSDRALEHALRVRLDFMLFCGSSVLDHCPDHTTICRFRQALVRRGLDAQLLTEVNRQLARLSGGSGCALAEEGQPVFLRLQGVHPDRQGRVCGAGAGAAGE